MIKHVYFILAAYLTGLANAGCTAQTSFACKISIPAYFVRGNIRISYNNGSGDYRRVVVKDADRFVVCQDSLLCRYAAVTVTYTDSARSNQPFSKSFFVGEGSSGIGFSDSKALAPLTLTYLNNGVDTDSVGGALLKGSIKKEQEALDDTYERVVSLQGKNDSLIASLFKQGDQLNRRRLAFIMQHPDLYFSYWLFRTGIILDKQFDIDTLVNIHSRVFPDSLKFLPDGAVTKKLLLSRMQTRVGMQALDFETKGVDGKPVSSKDYRGRFLLLDFWASWCTPCIKQIPKLESIIKDISPSKLSVLAVSMDNDYKAFDAAVKQHNLKWNQVFGDPQLSRLYAVVAIPQVILINGEGKVIYNMENEHDYELTRFRALLKAQPK